jgi:hypothetical protein
MAMAPRRTMPFVVFGSLAMTNRRGKRRTPHEDRSIRRAGCQNEHQRNNSKDSSHEDVLAILCRRAWPRGGRSTFGRTSGLNGGRVGKWPRVTAGRGRKSICRGGTGRVLGRALALGCGELACTVVAERARPVDSPWEEDSIWPYRPPEVKGRPEVGGMMPSCSGSTMICAGKDESEKNEKRECVCVSDEFSHAE